MTNTVTIKISYFAQNIILVFLLSAGFGGIVFPFLYKLTRLHFLLYAGAVKDACLFILLFVYFLCLTIAISKNELSFRRQIYNLFSPLILFSIFFLFACLKGHSSLGTIATITRRYYLPLFVILFFLLVDIRKSSVSGFLYAVVLCVIVFGFFEYFAPVSFWNSFIELPAYWIASGDRWATDTIMHSGRFASWDLSFLLGHPVRRMCSSFAEPTNFSSFCISCFLIFRKHKFIRLGCFLCCCFAVSKAALMVFFGLLPVLFFYNKIFRKKRRFDHLFILMFFFFFALSAVMYTAGFSIGPFSHIAGFYTGILNVFHGNLFGHGIGTIGNYAENISLKLSGLGSESGIGGMLGQCGLGAFFYLLFFVKLIKILQTDLNPRNYTAIVLIFAWAVICIFSESAFGASGNILFFMYPAMAVRQMLQAKQIKIKEHSL